MRQLIELAVAAIKQGEREGAERHLIELRRIAYDSGLPTPELPPDIVEVWLRIERPIVDRPKRDKAQEQALGEEAKQCLLEAGDIAARRLLELVQDDRLFGYSGMLHPAVQAGILTSTLGKALAVQSVAKQTALPAPEPEQPAVSSVLSMMVRRQRAEPEHEVIEGHATTG